MGQAASPGLGRPQLHSSRDADNKETQEWTAKLRNCEKQNLKKMQWAWPSIFFRLFWLQRPQRVCKRMKIEKLNWGWKAAVSTSPLGLFWAPCESQDWLALWWSFPRGDSRQIKSTWLHGVERNPASLPPASQDFGWSEGESSGYDQNALYSPMKFYKEEKENKVMGGIWWEQNRHW